MAQGPPDPAAAVPDVRHGVGEIDDQHLAILTLVQGAALAVRGDRSQAELRRHLVDLRGAVRSHFVSEETLMRLLLFPGLPEHRTLHGQMLERLDALTLGGGRVAVANLEALAQVGVWFVDHFREADRPYIDFLKANDARALASQGLFEKLRR